MSHREEASGKTQDTLERLCLSTGLGTPRGPPGRAGGSVWVNDVLRDFLNCFVFVYLDDILIYSRTLAVHQTHIHLVLQRLLENKLFVKREKCEFHASRVSFLSFIVQGGPEKVKAIAEWPVPATRKLVQCFLGFTNFCC
ncbi:hypothetical protein L3Q82_017212 [Scortum barcoo]|uniref:Uncharacterized protein n=1 Tax=Scortum barcoo TaxID=214431 RepID=A0ACB8VLX9_9TELE|nr:hypothetical protein L3Q82_017212 [Scortum barcoo]